MSEECQHNIQILFESCKYKITVLLELLINLSQQSLSLQSFDV